MTWSNSLFKKSLLEYTNKNCESCSNTVGNIVPVWGWAASCVAGCQMLFWSTLFLFCIFKTVLKQPKACMYILPNYLIPLGTLWSLKCKTYMFGQFLYMP